MKLTRIPFGLTTVLSKLVKTSFQRASFHMPFGFGKVR